MNLKEAFRFQNKLSSLMDEAQGILSDNSSITTVTNTYLRKKVMPEAENETAVDPPATVFFEQITEIAQFTIYLMSEREKLCKAIHEAKNKLPIDMDSEVSLNGKRQEIARVLKSMSDLRASEVILPNGGTGYRFNQEGNQVSYRCDVKRVTTINFDRNTIRKLAGSMNRKSDEISAELDRCMVNSSVDYEPHFDVNDSFSEIFGEYCSSMVGKQ